MHTCMHAYIYAYAYTYRVNPTPYPQASVVLLTLTLLTPAFRYLSYASLAAIVFTIYIDIDIY